MAQPPGTFGSGTGYPPPYLNHHNVHYVAASNNRIPKQTPITDDYEISSTVLGLGINGKVVQCTSRCDGKKYALKVRNRNSEFPLYRLRFSLNFRYYSIVQKPDVKLNCIGAQAVVNTL